MTQIEFNYKLLGLKENLNYFAILLTSNQEDAKDLVQDTFVKALTHREQFQSGTNLKAWAYTIMKNTFINNYRRNAKANTMVDTTDDLYYLNSSMSSEEESAESRMHVNDILQRIARLEESHRRPFEMHTNGFKYKEIAEALDLSIGTVKSRIFFTRKKLMEDLREFEHSN
ncbi:MAG TPA: RNA polymerase sigma factor [Bacteroidales bacterium]|nr:RNA polymerase sigma factor [Bacteroidales bacterium]HNS47682.1 RNA polymerase sigma factor [Bacteroidales bacterium]